jgi:hypothetical protein
MGWLQSVDCSLTLFTSIVPEFLLRKFHYGRLEDLSPAHKGIYESNTKLPSAKLF